MRLPSSDERGGDDSAPVELLHRGLRRARGAACLLTGGSDAPVELLLPLRGIAEAMTNQLHVSENLSLASALAAYTANAAVGCLREHEFGVLKKNFFADFVMLKVQCPKKMPLVAPATPEAVRQKVAADDMEVEEALQQFLGISEMHKRGVLQTWVGGDKVFDADAVEGGKRKEGDAVAYLCDAATGEGAAEKGPGGSGLRVGGGGFRWKCPCCR